MGDDSSFLSSTSVSCTLEASNVIVFQWSGVEGSEQHARDLMLDIQKTLTSTASPNAIHDVVPKLESLDLLLRKLGEKRDAVAQAFAQDNNLKRFVVLPEHNLYVLSLGELPDWVSDVRRFASGIVLEAALLHSDFAMWAARLWQSTQRVWNFVGLNMVPRFQTLPSTEEFSGLKEPAVALVARGLSASDGGEAAACLLAEIAMNSGDILKNAVQPQAMLKERMHSNSKSCKRH